MGVKQKDHFTIFSFNKIAVAIVVAKRILIILQKAGTIDVEQSF